MKVILLVVLLWVVKTCVSKVVSGWDQRLDENEIYYAENNIYFDGNSIDWNELDESRMSFPDWLFIFPGTKWCGSGNISGSYDDLGQFADTDRCCRDHDYCGDVISAHGTKYNLTNSAFYTRLNCQCDDKFRSCLRNVNSSISTKVGYIYFNILGTQCFREDYPAKCKRESLVPTIKCVEYEYDQSEEKLYQWFDVPAYFT